MSPAPAGQGLIIDRAASVLLIVDLQARLMPAIADGAAVVARALFLAHTAELLGVPVLVTEQNPAGLGRTVPELAAYAANPVEKRHFNACDAPAFTGRLPADRQTYIVAGAEAHVCVLQTALGLIERGKRVCIAADAVGSRRPSDREAGLRRLAAHGALIVTSEMAAFEWLGHADDPAFKAVMALIKPV
jgi:nicotinamidase-related amidase